MSATPMQLGLFGDPCIPVHVFRGRGYAATPGTGPQGETCRSCAHKLSVHSRSGAQSWLKCDLMQMSHGAGTDIRAAAPACFRWESK